MRLAVSLVALLSLSALFACGQSGGDLRGAATAPAGADGPAPKIVAQKDALDLGTVKEGEVVDAVFTIENQGDADLIIERVHTSCGCTTVELSDQEKTVPPGGKQSITARFNTRNRPGKQRKTITIRSNDPRQRELELTLTTDVLMLAQIVPGTLYVRNVRRGEVVARTLDILPTTKGATVEIVSLEMPGHVLTYTSTPIKGKESQGLRLRFQVMPDAPLGELLINAKLNLRVDDETETRTFRVRGAIIGDLSVRPAYVRLEKASPRGMQLRPVMISSSRGEPFRLFEVSAGPSFKTTVEPGKKNTEYTILVEIAEEAADGPCGAFLEARTDSVVQPLVRVPVYANVAPRLTVDPPIVLFKSDGSKEASMRRVLLATPGLSPFSVIEARCDEDFVDVAPVASERERPGQRYLRVVLKGGVKSDTHTASIALKTDVPGAESVEIPVVVMVPEGA